MLPNNEVRLPPPRAAQSPAVPRDITAEFTDAASSELMNSSSGLCFQSNCWFPYTRAQDWTARQG
jgi:hypothetical protein